MSERAPLLSLLRRLRRRLRALAAADGAVRGAAVGLAALTAALAVARWRGGGVAGPRAAAVVAVAAAIGAAWLGLRRIPLRRCARVIDRALDGQDRVLSALVFLDEPPTALGQAAIADAARRAAGLAPAAVAPARRPRGLPALAVAALVAGLTGALPARAPAARIGRAAASTEAAAAAGLRVPAARLAAEREEAERVAEAASALDDAELAGVARDLAAAVRALSDGTLPHGEALERLQALAERAAEEAAAGERERSAVRAAGSAMEQTAATRDVGAALGGDDPGAAERALQSLAARSGEAGAGERSQVAKAMDAAAQQAAAADAAAASANANAATGANAGAQSDSRRRLNRERPATAQNGAAGSARPPGERRLERLRRDLADTASACRENPEACKRKISERAQGDLPRMVGEGRRVEVWKRVEKAARQMRERLRRGDLGDQKQRRAGERRSRSGGQGQSGDEGGDPVLVETDNPNEADVLIEEDMDGEGEEAAAEAAAQASAAAAGSSAQSGGASEKSGGQGDGIGNQPGADPLGRAGQSGGARGSERQATVRNGAGPTRSQVIDAAAQRGFAQRGYGRVFDEYHAVVEEALDSGAVPEGRRYVVRRYFQLIRPRPQARKP